MGFTGLLHPDSVYDDAKGQLMREHLYPRLRRHYQFHNEKRLFKDVHHHTVFGVHVYSRWRTPIQFEHISNLYIPETIDGCYEHDGEGFVQGLKTENNEYNLRPHKKRIVTVDRDALKTFAACADSPETSSFHARMMRVHSIDSMTLLRKYANYPYRMHDLRDSTAFSQMWHETGAVNDGTIRRETRFPDTKYDFIYSGPHIFVSNPFASAPRPECRHNLDYDAIDLEFIPDNYLPRANLHTWK